jgi:hypothetical protein
MDTTITLRTPLWKEIVTALLCVAFFAAGVVLVVFGYQDSSWEQLLGGGGMALVFLAIGISEASSRIVLIADAEGLSVRANSFSKLKRMPWSNVIGFEKVVQTMPTKGATSKQIYLVVKLKGGEENPTARFLANQLNVSNTMEQPFRLGDIYIPSMKLPGKIDDLVVRLEEYRKGRQS